MSIQDDRHLVGDDLPLTLVASEDEEPLVRLRPGMDVRVTRVRVGGVPDLGEIVGSGSLCGGSGTCLAIVDKRSWVVDPEP